ncbi:MAG: tripartite tricarboxylate transporter TctB family protein [Alphaproteobacteria bacterium]
MKVRPQAIFSLGFVIFFIVFVYEAQGWRPQARLYPLAIGIPMLILAIIQLILDLKGVERKQKDDAAPVDFQFAQSVDPAVARSRTFNIFGWLFGFFIGIWLLGFNITIPLMVFGYLKIQSGEKWWLSLTLTAVAGLFFWFLFVWLLNLPFPDGVITTWISG